MTSVILEQCSYQLSYQANWELVNLLSVDKSVALASIAKVMGPSPAQACFSPWETKKKIEFELGLLFSTAY